MNEKRKKCPDSDLRLEDKRLIKTRLLPVLSRNLLF